jgi:hypothetical protein
MEKFTLKKINDVQVREQYQVNISNAPVTLENFEDNVGINSACDSTRVSYEGV